MVILHIFESKAVFYIFDSKTLNLSTKEQELVYLYNIQPGKNPKLYRTTVSTLYKTGEKNVAILHIYGA